MTGDNDRKQKRRRKVEVVICPDAFPDFTTVGGSHSRRDQQRRSLARGGREGQKTSKGGNDIDGELPALNIQETIREVHKYGADGFVGVQKKAHANSEYERLTGRTAKRQKMPTKIVVGMRRKQLKRKEREEREAKESGVVNHHTPQSKSKGRKRKQDGEGRGGQLDGIFGSNRARNKGERRTMSARSFGPSPGVGFMVKGMLKVKQPGSR